MLFGSCRLLRRKSFEEKVLDALQRIEKKLNAAQIKEEKMDKDIQAIIDQATANENAEKAAIDALAALFARFTAAVGAAASLSAEDRATLQAKVQEMAASSSAVAAAIVANTAAAA